MKNLENTNKWTNGNKTRYYFTDGMLNEAKAYFTTDENDVKYAKYSWNVDGGFVSATKLYAGKVSNELNDIFETVKSNN